mgnify:CR=1 FL=1
MHEGILWKGEIVGKLGIEIVLSKNLCDNLFIIDL